MFGQPASTAANLNWIPQILVAAYGRIAQLKDARANQEDKNRDEGAVLDNEKDPSKESGRFLGFTRASSANGTGQCLHRVNTVDTGLPPASYHALGPNADLLDLLHSGVATDSWNLEATS